MQRGQGLIIATSAIIFLFIIFTTSDRTCLIWRKLLNNSAGIIRPYQAPLLSCDGPSEDIVPQSYVVFLHYGCSLEQHKQTVSEGADLDSAIRFVFPETDFHGLYYHAYLDDGPLAAVRSDIVVDMVECSVRPHPADFDFGEEVE